MIESEKFHCLRKRDYYALILGKVAKALNEPVEPTKSCNETALASYFTTFHDNGVSHVIEDYETHDF